MLVSRRQLDCTWVNRQARHDLHECMRESDFGAIHGAIAHPLDKGEVVGILGIEENLINDLLQTSSSVRYRAKAGGDLTLTASILNDCISDTSA